MTSAESPAALSSQFFQCSNPNCTLRFPAPANYAGKPMLCPRCKSPVHPVPTRLQVSDFNLHQSAQADNSHLEVLLDNIRSTFNVGAMLRTSDGVGIQRAHLCGITPQPGNPRISKVALGAEFSVPWEYHTNGVQAASACKTRGLQLWALEIQRGAVSIFDLPPETLSQPAVLAVGNEVTGIDPEILDLCDQSFYIPMHGYKRSLNVAIAFGIAVYMLRFGFQNHRKLLDPSSTNTLQ